MKGGHVNGMLLLLFAYAMIALGFAVVALAICSEIDRRLSPPSKELLVDAAAPSSSADFVCTPAITPPLAHRRTAREIV